MEVLCFFFLGWKRGDQECKILIPEDYDTTFQRCLGRGAVCNFQARATGVEVKHMPRVVA